MFRKTEYLNVAQIIFYLVVTYLIFQFHEMGHWLTSIFFGQKFVVFPAGVIQTTYDESNQLANVTIEGMGVVFNLILSVIGILLLTKSEDRFWTRTGYFIGYISSIGMVGYHIAGLFGLLVDNDSASIARYLNISPPVVIIPVTVIFVLLSVVIIRNTPKEYKGPYYPSIFFLMILLERFLVVFLYETYMYRQYYNGGFVIEPILSFPLSLLLINLISIGLFILFVANRKRYFQYRAA